MYEAFESLDTVVVAISQEDTSLDKAGTFLKPFDPLPYFDIAHDLERKVTSGYDRTTAYLIDKKGVVREIFPMIIHARPSWKIILAEVEKLDAEQKR